MNTKEGMGGRAMRNAWACVAGTQSGMEDAPQRGNIVDECGRVCDLRHRTLSADMPFHHDCYVLFIVSPLGRSSWDATLVTEHLTTQATLTSA